MKAEEFSNALGNIREEYLLEAEQYQKKSSKHILRWAAAIIAVIVSIGGIGIGVEAAQYQEAVAFFEKNDLSTENLSRSDIIKIYQDITTKRFEYSKTAELLIRTASAKIDGFLIHSDGYSPEELQGLMELFDEWSVIREQEQQRKPGITYDYETVYYDDQLKNYACVIRKYVDTELQWEVTIPGYHDWIDNVVVENEYICIYDDNWRTGTPDFFALLDADGTILFEGSVKKQHGTEIITSATITENALILFSQIKYDDGYRMGFYKYDFSGKLLQYTESRINGTGYKVMAQLKDGFLVKVGSFKDANGDFPAMVAKVDTDGNVLFTNQYGAGEYKYQIHDMIEYEGKIYISVDQTPKGQDLHNGENSLFQQILDKNREGSDFDWQSDSYIPTQMLRDYYDATLLICNAETLEVEDFYSVYGALAGELKINTDGELEWDVEMIANVFVSMATSSFTFGGLNNLYRYRFDPSGDLIEYVDTMTTVIMRK